MMLRRSARLRLAPRAPDAAVLILPARFRVQRLPARLLGLLRFRPACAVPGVPLRSKSSSGPVWALHPVCADAGGEPGKHGHYGECEGIKGPGVSAYGCLYSGILIITYSWSSNG